MCFQPIWSRSDGNPVQCHRRWNCDIQGNCNEPAKRCTFNRPFTRCQGTRWNDWLVEELCWFIHAAISQGGCGNSTSSHWPTGYRSKAGLVCIRFTFVFLFLRIQDGLVYLPEIKYRRILNKAFGPGGWGLAPRSETNVGPKIVSREYALVCFGRLFSFFFIYLNPGINCPKISRHCERRTRVLWPFWCRHSYGGLQE